MNEYYCFKRFMMQIPNLISLSRLFFTVVFVLAINSNRTVLAVFSMLAIIASDIMDGWFARRYELESNLGAVLDVVMDKISVFVLALAMMWNNYMPIWFGALLLTKDSLLIIGWILVNYKHGSWYQPKANILGKFSGFSVFTVFLFTIFCSLDLEYVQFKWFCSWLTFWYVFSLGIAYASLIHYFSRLKLCGCRNLLDDKFKISKNREQEKHHRIKNHDNSQ